MKTKTLFRSLSAVSLVFAIAGCQGDDLPGDGARSGLDIQGTLDALAHAEVVDVDRAGVPTFVKGKLAWIDRSEGLTTEALHASVQATLSTLAPALRANAEELVLKQELTDAQGDQHFRFAQIKNGLEVIGGEVVLHVRDDLVYAVNGSARGDLAAPAAPSIGPGDAISRALGDAVPVLDAAAKAEPRLAYRAAADRLSLVYVVKVTGLREDGTPVDDDVLVDAVDGSIAGRIPHIHTAKNRELHNLNHGTTLPGPLSRTEGAPPVADVIVNNNYDRLGTTYDCYQTLFNRDSYNNAGAKLVSSVHYSTNYVNAFWDGTQMVYGDGDGIDASNLANSLDVTAHELTHAVTETSSNLTYSGESGGLNEAMSDIFGNVCEWFRDGQVVSANTWKVGEDVWTPATADDALRYMNDPVLDGGSLDYYPDYSAGVDVHYSSGIANLAFYLLSQGGTHPRGKTTTVVTGIGIQKASQVFYRANTTIMTSSTDFAGAKTATEQAASQLGYTAAEIASVTAAWEAVGVGVPVPPPVTTPLTNNVPVSGVSGATGNKKYYTLDVPAGATSLTFTTSGGSGDADLYVKFGAAPTTSSYDCRPYLNGNAETCTIANIQAGTYYVMLHAYSSYSGLTLNGAYTTGGGGGGSVLVNGVPVSNLSGAKNSMKTWTLAVPAGQASLTFTTSGGSGNVTLYVKRGSAPSTSVYDCRSRKPGNAESCTFQSPIADTWYVSLEGASAYSGVTLKGQY